MSQQDQYQELYSNFRWHVPTHVNIAQLCVERWALGLDARRVAIFHEDAQGHDDAWTYADLYHQSARLANGLLRLGVKRGDRVAIVLPQRPETVAAHMACYMIGAVAMPLSTLFGPDALQYRIHNAEASVAIVEAQSMVNLLAVRDSLPRLRHIIGLDHEHDVMIPWRTLLARQSEEIQIVNTKATDPAVLIYTSGTTGQPKGALLPHSVLIGHLPGFVASQNWFPRDGDVLRSPADWAWIGGLFDALMPTLYFGMPIVSYKGRFDAENEFELLQRYNVTNAFFFPTAIKTMMRAVPNPRERYALNLRAIMSGGEALGSAAFEWCEQQLGVTPNEIFGQTEANYVLGASADKWPARSGSMGKPYPGHRIAILNDQGQPVAQGEVGEVCIHRLAPDGEPDPVMFLHYWRNEAATAEKFNGQWLRTGDLARQDADGYFWYEGRSDDMFNSAGYRIGPTEIENVLLRHPAVGQAAIVGKPDAERGAIVKAYIVLSPGHETDDMQAIVNELQDLVKGSLAAYQYPKEIEFIEQMPMTTTGKIQRRLLRQRDAAPSKK